MEASEDLDVGVNIGQVVAVDRDTSDSNRIRYSLIGERLLTFTVK